MPECRLKTESVGPEVIFSTDPLAEVPRSLLPLPQRPSALAWETATGDLVAEHLDATGTTGNFLQGLSSFATAEH